MSFALKASPQRTIAAPFVTQPSVPIAIPKQWYKGTGRQSRSFSEKRIRSGTNRALFTMFMWVSVAPFGEPVVPDVN